LSSAQSDQSSCRLALNENPEAGVHKRCLFLNPCDSAGFGDEIVIKYQCCAHMHQYALKICIRQVPVSPWI